MIGSGGFPGSLPGRSGGRRVAVTMLAMKTTQRSTETVPVHLARQLMAASQGLDRAPAQPATKADVLATIRSMGELQVDTISVVARSPYLVLWSRLGDYQPAWLDELLAEGALFERWAHAACFLPMDDYPLHRRRMLDAIEHGGLTARWAVKWLGEHAEVVERVIAHLRENGSARSAEFENPAHRSSGWWDWKEEKNALEALWLTGEVMVAARRNFQRVYALRERVLPGWDDAALPSSEEMLRSLDLRTVHALGITTAAWAPDYFRQLKTGVAKRLEVLASDGQLVRMAIEGLPGPAYVHPERLDLLEQVASGKRRATLTTLLSPFDPLVWDRQRARELFDFDYMIECYTPAAKRRYGYFTLPILHRGRLVGRLDPKAHRSQGVFEVKAVHLEPGVTADEELAGALAGALVRCAAWHGTPDVLVRESDPPTFGPLLQDALRVQPT